MGSNEASGVDRKRFEENISVSDCRAACVCPTETRPSACFRTASGFENGAILYSCDEVFFSFGCRVGDVRIKSTHLGKVYGSLRSSKGSLYARECV